MTTAHVYEIFIRADRQRVWQALVDPDDTVRYFHGTRFESSFEPGDHFRSMIVEGNRLAVDGLIETIEPPHRLGMTWHIDDDEVMAAEPPGRVEWTLTPADDDGAVTRVTLRHGELALSPATWEHVRLGWVEILSSLKSLLETGEPLPAVDAATASPDPAEVEGNWHRAQAITANNSVWELLGRDELDAEAGEELLERAYAAAHHWRRATGATTINRARAAWLLSRAHAVLGHGGPALHHAERCSALTEQAIHDAADFDLAYVYEALARALACLGRLDEARQIRRRAATATIANAQDRAVFAADLAAEPWFGLTDG